MATPTSGQAAQGTNGFRQAQAGLVIALDSEIAQVYAQQLDVADLKGTLPLFKRAMQAVARRYGMAHGALSLNFYRKERQVAGITTAVRLPAPSPPTIGKLDTGLDWATKGLWSKTPDVESSLTDVTGVTERAVMNVGRDAVLNSVQADKKALGWARVTKATPCSFCALLSTRGAVYKSEQTADFQAHNNCQCFAVPVFTSYEPTAQIREYQALYQQHPGLNNFRRAYEAKYGL